MPKGVIVVLSHQRNWPMKTPRSCAVSNLMNMYTGLEITASLIVLKLIYFRNCWLLFQLSTIYPTEIVEFFRHGLVENFQLISNSAVNVWEQFVKSQLFCYIWSYKIYIIIDYSVSSDELTVDLKSDDKKLKICNQTEDTKNNTAAAPAAAAQPKRSIKQLTLQTNCNIY